MDTGLYYGIRFFEHRTGEPELTFNRRECKELRHLEYFVANPKKLLPFGVKINGTGYNLSAASFALKALSECDESIFDVGVNPNDWVVAEYGGNTYVNFTGKHDVFPGQPVGIGIYRLRLHVAAGVPLTYYSDPFYVNDFVSQASVPNYTITFGVTGANGTLSAAVAGVNISSGTTRWGGTVVSFKANPNKGYFVKQWTVNGTVVQGQTGTDYAIILTENIHVTVEYRAVVYSKEYSQEYLK
jgi:hypothetical protein